jgi:hypothetical protein
MPELYARAIKKWERDYSGIAPNVDFANGVRIGDIGIDTGTSPRKQWRCDDNAIGAPVWTMLEYGKGAFSVPDNTTSYLTVGNKVVDTSIDIEYSLSGGTFHHEGTMKVSHDGATAYIRDMFGGNNPVHDIDLDADVSGDDMRIVFDTTDGVGEALTFNYKIVNRIYEV